LKLFLYSLIEFSFLKSIPWTLAIRLSLSVIKLAELYLTRREKQWPARLLVSLF
jgi:hypothetical protein